MKRYLLPLTFLASLALAAPSPAKEVAKVKVCGASGCHETSDRAQLAGIGEGGSNIGPPTSRSPFYNVTLTVRAGEARDRWTIAYLPARHVIRTQDPSNGEAWLKADPGTAALYAKLIGDLKPFPASRLPAIKPITARVAEVVAPPAPSPAAADTSGGFPWLVLVLAGGAGLAVTAVFGSRRLRARRTSSSPAPTPAS